MDRKSFSTYFVDIYSVVTDSKSATESADFSRVRIHRLFAAISDGFGSFVRE